MLKKILSVALALVMIASVAVMAVSCSNSVNDDNDKQDTQGDTGASDNKNNADDDKSFKVGFIFLHDKNSTYDLNFMNAVEAAQKALNLTDSQVIMKTNVPEGQECFDACEDLVEQGCSLIFADSFGHEPYMIEAAQKYTDVQFCHATGTRAHTEKLDNYHNAFASIYEGRYLAGVAAGMKLNELIADGKFSAEEAMIGYVGAYTYAEVISGYTSFFLGAKSVCPTVKMKVQFTGSWYDEAAEKEAANSLISAGCKLISQHADSMGAPTACEAQNIPNVSYNGSTVDSCPNTFIVSSAINWAPYMQYIIDCVMNGKAIDTDWTGTLDTGSVVLSDINEKAAAAGTAEKLKEVEADLKSGKLHVFDVSTFTVDGKAVGEDHQADVDTDDSFTPDTKVVINGYFHESEFRSAPYFDLKIDGIELVNSEF